MRRLDVWTAGGVCLAGALLLAGCAEKAEKSEDAAAAAKTAETETPAAMSGGSTGPMTFSGSDTLWNSSASLGAPVATFGNMPAWTPTTVKAANRGTTGKPATVIGEVVDVSCYMQLGKRGEAHIPCGTNCVQNGAPIGVVDAKNQLFVVMAEEHDPRRYGNTALTEAMLPFMAKTVQVEGMLTERQGVKTLFVLGYTMGDTPNLRSGN